MIGLLLIGGLVIGLPLHGIPVIVRSIRKIVSFFGLIPYS